MKGGVLKDEEGRGGGADEEEEGGFEVDEGFAFEVGHVDWTPQNGSCFELFIARDLAVSILATLNGSVASDRPRWKWQDASLSC